MNKSVKTDTRSLCNVGVLLTLADLYRQSMPGLSERIGDPQSFQISNDSDLMAVPAG